MTLELECLDFLLRVARGQEECVSSHNIDDAEKTIRTALAQSTQSPVEQPPQTVAGDDMRKHYETACNDAVFIIGCSQENAPKSLNEALDRIAGFDAERERKKAGIYATFARHFDRCIQASLKCHGGSDANK